VVFIYAAFAWSVTTHYDSLFFSSYIHYNTVNSVWLTKCCGKHCTPFNQRVIESLRVGVSNKSEQRKDLKKDKRAAFSSHARKQASCLFGDSVITFKSGVYYSCLQDTVLFSFTSAQIKETFSCKPRLLPLQLSFLEVKLLREPMATVCPDIVHVGKSTVVTGLVPS